MSEKWEIEYLELLKNIFSQKVLSADIEELEGKPSLVLTLHSPVKGDMVDIQFTIEHLIENTDQMQIMTSMFTGVEESKIGGLEKIIMKLNEFLTLGNIGIFYEAGQIFYNHAFVFDRNTEVSAVTAILGTTLDIITATVINAMKILYPVVSGEITAEILLAQELDIIQ